MAITGEAIFDVSEEKLKEIIRANAKSVGFTNQEMIRELERRASDRQARASNLLSVVSVAIAVAAVIVAAVKS